MSASNRPIKDALSQRNLTFIKVRNFFLKLTWGWIDYNPFKTAGEQKQKEGPSTGSGRTAYIEDPGLQVCKLPENAEDLLRLAIALCDNDPRYVEFQFKKEPSLLTKMTLVSFLCEEALKQSGDQLKDKMIEIDTSQDPERIVRFQQAYGMALAAERENRKDKSLTRQAQLLMIERAKTEVETEELDSQIDQIKTKTRREKLPHPPRPLDSFITFFHAPTSPDSLKIMELKKIDEEFQAGADLYLKEARGMLGNYIKNHDDKSFVSFAQPPKTAQDYFELAYAIADRNALYKGEPVVLDFNGGSAWAIKAKKWYSVLHLLTYIPYNSDCFRNHADKIGALRSQTRLLQNMAMDYSKQYEQQPLSLEQILKANEAQEALLKCFEALSQTLGQPQEEKQAETAPAGPAATSPKV